MKQVGGILELEEEAVKLTAGQKKHLQKIFAELDKEDFSWDVKYGYREVQARVLASVAGWLWARSYPFAPVLKAVNEYALKRFDLERNK